MGIVGSSHNRLRNATGMKISQIEVGKSYTNGASVRRVDVLNRGDVTYTITRGPGLGSTRSCWITTFADWAKVESES